MKRYRLKVGDLKVVEEHPAGDLISISELQEKLKLKEFDKVDAELFKLLREMISLP